MPSRAAESTRRIVVALDGPASSGKSSVGAAAAEQLQLRFVDTGLFYRALTALALLEGVELDDPVALVPLVDRVSLGDDGSGRFTRVLLDGSDATEEARSALVDGSVSTVAKVPEVRAALLERQRELAAEGGIVMAGRDVGTVVLPEADLKLFLDASVEERARRRIEERGLDPDGAEAEEVREALRARDAIDTGREVAPLRAADDAVHVLTDGNAFDETVEIVAAEIAGVMLTPRPRTRSRKAPVAPVDDAVEAADVAAVAEAVVPDEAEVADTAEAPEVAETAEAPEVAETKPKRTRTRKVAAAAAVIAAEPKPKRVRKAKAAPAPEPEPQPEPVADVPVELEPTTEIEAEAAGVPETEPEPVPVPTGAPLATPTRRAQARARSTARKTALATAASAGPAATGDAASEPADESTRQVEDSAEVGQDSSPQVDANDDAGIGASDPGPDSTSQGEEDRADPEASPSQGDEASPEAVAEPSKVHTPTHRSQARARATARRAASTGAGPAATEPVAVEHTQPDTDVEPQPEPAAKPAHTPTRRSEARSRATARRAALAAAAASGENAAIDAEPDSGGVSEPPAKPAHIPTRRAQARSRATARRAATGTSAASASGEAPIPEPEAEPEPVAAAAQKSANTPTRRSQARSRATAKRAALAAAATPASAEPALEPLPEPEPEQPEPEPRPEPELEPVVPIAAATATARAPRGPRPAAKPKERDAILEAAMQLDNDPTMMIRMIALVARIGSRLFADVEVTGLDHIPRHGAVILAVNHISNADPVVVGAWITDTLKRRRIHWMGKRELFAWPVLGWIAAHGGIHPVDRDAADVEAFRLATKILENGYVLLVFPEGTRSPTGELQEAKDGVAMLALRTGAQIVPIGISNTDAVWRKGRALPLPFPRRHVTVRVGLPFHVQDVIPAGVARREAKSLATTEIMGRIAALLEPRHRGIYAGAVHEERPPKR